jgi:hypothetical protein
MSDRWDNKEALSRLKCRVLIIHGASDEVIPFAHAEILRDVRAANGLRVAFFPTQGTHNYFSYYRDYLHPVEVFLRGHDAIAAPALPDPLPGAKYSREQVKAIVELRRGRVREGGDSESAAARAASAADAEASGLDRREGSPDSTLLDGDEIASGRTTSEDEREETVGFEGARGIRDSLEFSNRRPHGDAGSIAGTPRRVSSWRKSSTRGYSFEKMAVAAAEHDSDSEAMEKVPGGASPFGMQKSLSSAR